MANAIGACSCADHDALARDLLDECGLAAPANPFALAWCMNLRCVHRRGIGVELAGDEIVFDWKQAVSRQQALVLRGCAAAYLREQDRADDEQSVTMLASALSCAPAIAASSSAS